MINEINIIEEKHIYTSDEKLKWFGYGEWVEEIDRIVFEFMGYTATVNRVIAREPCDEEIYFGGHLCGYLKIPKDHPYYQEKNIDIDCHYGLTFNKLILGDHWIGFDCGHAGDFVPTMEKLKNQNRSLREFREMFPPHEEFKEFAIFNPIYRNMEYCIENCIYMIEQLEKIKKTQKKQQQLKKI